MRPMQEMTLAPATVAASEAFGRDRQMRKSGHQIALIRPGEGPGSAHRSGLRESIDVPVERFAVTHMTGDAGF